MIRFDGRGNLIDDCPACDAGGNQRIGCPARAVDKPETVAETVRLRALVCRLKTCLRKIEPYVVSPTAAVMLTEALNDHGGPTYEIH